MKLLLKTGIAAAAVLWMGTLLASPASALPPGGLEPFPEPTRPPILSTATPPPLATVAPTSTPAPNLTEVTGYVCATTYTRQNNVGFGNGWVRVTLYTQPFCAGSYVAQVYALGPGAANYGFQHDQPERLALFGRAHKAAIAGKRGSFFVDMPNGGIFHSTYRAD
jgi:hypothetical protein